MSKSPKTLTTDECHRLLDTLRNADGTPKQVRRGIRNHTLALVMLDAGLRVSETTNLDVTDLLFNNAPVTSVLVRPEIAKNHKERSVPVSSRLSEAISQMFMAYWSDHYKNGHHKAFPSKVPDKPLTTRQVEKIICAAGWKALGRPVHPHVLRHTFASKLMRVTNIRTVQELLGHKNITSTQIYTHPNEQDKHKAIENMDRSEVSSYPASH
ncbi:Tyrosine recombinase XerC [subsurface metagenome]